MSAIRNEASKNGFLLRSIRELLEHRALWLYLLRDEARARGLEWEPFANAAIMRCGLYQGARLVGKGGTKSLKGLKRTLFTLPARAVFEMKIRKSTDDELSIDFSYCPLVKAWQKQGASDEDIGALCDVAMRGDQGIGEAYGCRLDLPKSIAKGDSVCELRYRRLD
ncbi:MAG: L-2-amino-thiazoline-4-carboxylic acid hydrolase [Spirochaetes bacterium]|nr:L-2-amino-thiazoline-4-carboxylic acid hydrolase [Spirochaetota bacterium]MBU1080775.1 L-2-amino-thiazoline-4-carboxylic acid hydrolase [Spirochaetota bacterium]